MDIKLSAAVSRNGFIDVPGVKLSDLDRVRLRKRIKHEAVIISRGSYEKALEIRRGKPFDCTETMVITTKDISFPNCKTASSFHEGLQKLRDRKRVVVLGGKRLYEEALCFPETSEIYITELDVKYDGKVKFPELDLGYWKLSETKSHGRANPPVVFKTYTRSCPFCTGYSRRKFFGNPVKEEVFWDFHRYGNICYLAIYKRRHTPVMINQEASQELNDFIKWLEFEHKEGWKILGRLLDFDHKHIFFGWRAIAP